MQNKTGNHSHELIFSDEFVVVICDKSKVFNFYSEILKNAGFVPQKYGLVMVKPNVCGYYPPQLELIEHTLKFFESLTQRIVIGETNSSLNTPEERFNRLGILDMLSKFGDKINAMNLMLDEIIDVTVPSPNAISHLPIPKLVNNCDLLVNIPRVGTHSNTMLTCAYKNLFGLLAERRKYSVYHPLGIENVIADVAKTVRCDLNVVDANEKVIIGVDPLCVDIVACKFVGLDPLKVDHLRLVSNDRNLEFEDVVDQLHIIEM